MAADFDPHRKFAVRRRHVKVFRDLSALIWWRQSYAILQISYLLLETDWARIEVKDVVDVGEDGNVLVEECRAVALVAHCCCVLAVDVFRESRL